jgi:hypothetical protein
LRRLWNTFGAFHKPSLVDNHPYRREPNCAMRAPGMRRRPIAPQPSQAV